MNEKLRPRDFKAIVESTREVRKHVRHAVERGRWQDAEPDLERRKAFNTRILALSQPRGAEAIVGNTNDLQAVSFLVEGAQVRRAVGFLEVNDVRQSTVGTGFLISPRLLITNQHVIPDAAAARSAQVTFDRENGVDGRPRPETSFLLDPDTFALFSPKDELDYAVVALGARNSGIATVEELGFLPLSNTPDRHVLGMNLNIIQHPNGWPKMLALRNNLLTARGEEGRTLVYETDTEQGSSGSPVLSDLWDVVALHHWGEPFLDRKDDEGRPLPTNVNEGVRISAIYEDLARRLGQLPPAQAALLKEALSLNRQPPAAGPTLQPARPNAEGAGPGHRPEPATPGRNSVNVRREPAPDEVDTGGITTPVEVMAREGQQPEPSPAEPRVLSAFPARRLTHAAEAKKLDKDYENREGYDPAHIPGVQIPLPKVAASEIAPLRATEPKASGGELNYEHFSVVMHKTRRMAIYTATNIDGATYLDVDRKSGKVSDGGEGETWYKDPRISESFWTGQDFYSSWATYFDRGHLTRRTDPTWGTADEAERANADTFHFTNCSPQHFRFNETTPYWQGAERYVLENGLLERDPKKRVSVFQGPIFDDTVDLYADDLQIPSSFFKVIVWPGAKGLKAVGLVVDQRALLNETRVSLGAPHGVARVNVGQWRVAIAKIEQRTGIDFGSAVRNADTITEVAQPGVGAEALVRLTKLGDILARR